MTQQRSYQAFISCTFTDLQEARQELVLALLSMGVVPTGTELHPGGNNERWAAIQRVIVDCDYHIVLLGGRYGSLSPIGLSHIHSEFVYARTKQKPVIAFVHDHPEVLPEEQRETSDEGQAKFRDFRQLLKDQASVHFWSTPAGLADMVRKTMPEFIDQYPATGWVRPQQVSHMGARRDVQELQQRIEELEQEKVDLAAGYNFVEQGLSPDAEPLAVSYNCNAYVKGDCKARVAESTLGWDQLFACMAPQMLEPVPESVMRAALEDKIANQALTDVQRQLPKAHAVRNITLNADSFNQIKVQLRAQGLIHNNSDVSTSGELRWQLTPLGDQAMTRVMARSGNR